MPDVHTPKQRSHNMSRIRGKDTKPEIKVRKLLHGMGYRFRLHRKDLPGKPDIVLPRYQTVIFVHGCYWHRHSCRYGKPVPETNRQFWEDKFEANIKRDKRNQSELKSLGWNVVVIWECETKDIQRLEKSIRKKIR